MTGGLAGILLDREGARRYGAQFRAAGQTLVFTNGCFDLLHAGHVQYLTAARALGDALLVGLNSDGSTRLLKGPSRPVVGQDERAALLLALRAVDAVVLFDEPTAAELLDLVRPALYVKGSDYALGGAQGGVTLPEAPVVRAYGGQIRLLPYLEGHSTSSLIARIKGL